MKIKQIVSSLLLTSIVAFHISSIVIVCNATCVNKTTIELPTYNFNTMPLNEINVIQANSNENDLSVEEMAFNEYNAKLAELHACSDKEKWFIEYKELIDKYSNELDLPETIYDYYSSDELDLLYRVVEAEVGDYGFNEKCNVISVILNRISDERFGNTLNEVLIPSQFATISNGRYKKKTPTEQTKLACEYCFMIEDTTNGALFFESSFSSKHITYAEFIFSDESGHKFYKN